MRCKNLLSLLLVVLASRVVLGQTGAAQPLPGSPSPGPFPESSQPAPTTEATVPATEQLTTFDPQHVDAMRSGKNWQLVADGVVLKDFGWNEADARQALRMIHDFGLNQHGLVGSPNPVMEYWLHDGKAPVGEIKGLVVTPLDTASLRVEARQRLWFLRDSRQMLFNFGSSAADAQLALAVMHKYGFTQIAAFGQPRPVMLVFLDNNSRPASPTAPVAPVSPASFQTPQPPPQTQVSPPTFRDMGEVQPKPPIAPPSHPPLSAPALQPTSLPAEGGAKTERTTFDWRDVKFDKTGATWKLICSGHELAQFNNEHDAKTAVSVFLHYHLTERDQVGSEKGHFSYYLADGKIPQGAIIGVQTELMQPDRLQIVQVGDQWTISAGNRPLLKFGDKIDEARHVLDVIQKNKCDRLCRIGMNDESGLTFLARTR
jgi:hypothetical protein